MGNSVTSEYQGFVLTYRIAVACRNGIQFYMTSGLKKRGKSDFIKIGFEQQGHIYI